MMERDDAEEFTQSMGQILTGSWRQIMLAKKLGVPDALGMTVEEWVRNRIGGYVRLSIDDRREAVLELKADGHSDRAIAEVLGVGLGTVQRDRADPNGSVGTDSQGQIDDGNDPNGPLDPKQAARDAAEDKRRLEQSKRDTLIRITEYAYRGTLQWAVDGFAEEMEERLSEDSFKNELVALLRLETRGSREQIAAGIDAGAAALKRLVGLLKDYSDDRQKLAKALDEKLKRGRP